MKYLVAFIAFLLGLSFNVSAQGVPSCVASFTFQPTSGAGIIQFTNTSSSNNISGVTYSWDFGDNHGSTDFSPSHQYVNPGIYNVCLSIFVRTPNGLICSDTVCQAVTVGQVQPCIDPALIDPNVACPAIYAPVCGCDGVTYSNDCEAKYGYGVTHWTQGACSGGGTCQASFVFQSGQSPTDIYFVNTSFANNNYYATTSLWDFGDGSTSTDPNPYHSYTSSGMYYVCLTITVQASQMGPVCTSTYCDSIYVGNNWPACWADFTFAITSVGVQFTDNSLVTTNTYATFWDFGDGTTSTDFNPFHAYQNPGTYTVCLKLFAPASGLACRDSICKTVAVGVNNPCIDSSLISPNCLCPAIYAPVCGCNGVTYGNYCEAQCNGVTQWTQGSCSNPPGCQASFSFQIDPNSLTIYFANTSTGVNTFNFSSSWDFGDNTFSSDNHPVHTYQASGTYQVCLVITTTATPGTSCTDTFCSVISIGVPTPCIDSSLINPNCICYMIYAPVCGCDGVTYDNDCFARCHGVTSYTQGACHQQACRASFTFTHVAGSMAVQFNNTSSSNNNTFTSDWDFGDGTTSTDKDPLHTYTSAGTYYVCLSISVITPNGVICTDTYCDSIRVGTNHPCVDLSVIDSTVVCLPMGIPGVYCGCDGNTYASQCEAYYYHGVTSGTWSISGQCGGQGCQAGFSFQPDPNAYGGQFSNTSNPAPVPGTLYQSHWDFGDGTTSTDHHPHHSYNAPGVYYVCLTITVPTSNGTICTSTYCDSVHVGHHAPCIDPTLIDPSIACIQIYDPVCGCDGVTYSNKCEAVYHHGVTTWTPGPCGGGGNCSAKFVWNYGIVPPTIFFTDISTGGNITGWHWDFGDGSTSNQQNPAHDFLHPGTYVVCLTISCASLGQVFTDTWCDTIHQAAGCIDPTLIDPNYQCPTVYQPVCGCDSVTYANSCIAKYGHGVTSWTPGPCQNNVQCHANFTFQAGPNNHPNTINFTNLSTGPATNWSWDFGDGTSSSDKNPVHTYAQSGRYTVCLTISGPALTCIDTFCDTIFIHGCIDPSRIIPGAQCPATYQPVCGCDSVTYYNACVAEKRNGVTSWTPGPCHNNCNANFTFNYLQQGNQIQFFNHSTGTYSRLKWNFGDGTFANNVNDPIHLYDVTGWYRVCLTISNPNGSCNDVYCDSVFATGCTDPALIDPNQACPAVYQPVCGCDGVTYQNACVATYDYGITSFTQGACPNFGYCPTSGQDNNRVWISRVGSNLSGDDGGYAHFDLCHRTQLAGKTYILKLNGATASPAPNFQAHWRVWWDFNHDFDFDDPGELVWQGFGALDQFAVYTIPVDACSGCTRMRVTLSDNFQGECGNYAVGETEDYDITIRSNVLCPPVLMPAQHGSNDLKTNDPNELEEEFAQEFMPISMSLYPNPAQDIVNVQLTLAEQSQRVTVKLLDISGKEIYKQVITDGGSTVSLPIETSPFANGIYQLIAQNDEGFRQVQKLVITR